MPKVLGTKLRTEGRVFHRCDVTHWCSWVPHHDHTCDLVHQLLLQRLSPGELGEPSRRADGGGTLGAFLALKGKAALDQVEKETLPSGRKLLRFLPTLVCETLNPVDGNGKRHPEHDFLIPEEARYWSMTPGELLDVRIGRRSWWQIYEADQDREERLGAAVALADAIVAKHREDSLQA